MQGFFRHIFTTVLLFALLFEGTLRITGIAGHKIPAANIDGNFLLQPGAEGVWIAGAKGEIQAKYSINPQGYNSIRNFEQDLANDFNGKVSIALLGNSYIEGYHNDVEESIGRLLESYTNDSVVVHQYGRMSANIADYALLYQQHIRGKYDYVYVLAMNQTVTQTTPRYMDQGQIKFNTEEQEKCYDRIHLVRYFRYNLKLVVKYKKEWEKRMTRFNNKWKRSSIHSQNPLKKTKTGKKPPKRKIHREAIETFGEETFFLFEKQRMRYSNHPLLKDRCVEIFPVLLPDDFGFDGHWNMNGQKNCARAMKNHLDVLRKAQTTTSPEDSASE